MLLKMKYAKLSNYTMEIKSDAPEFSYLCHNLTKILHLGIKNKRICFVLHSFFRIFAPEIEKQVP